MSNLRVLSVAAFALVIAACAAAPTGAPSDSSPDTQTGSTSSESSAASAASTTKAATTTSTDAGTGVDAAAADRCYSTCIAADAEAKAIDDGWVACKSSCTNGACVATCNTAADAMCGQAANHAACTKLGACWTQCFGPS